MKPDCLPFQNQAPILRTFPEIELVPPAPKKLFSNLEVVTPEERGGLPIAYDKQRAFITGELNVNVVNGSHVDFSAPGAFHEIFESPYTNNLQPISEADDRIIWGTQMDSGILIKITSADNSIYVKNPPKVEHYGPFKVDGITQDGDTSSKFGSKLYGNYGGCFEDTPCMHQAMIPTLNDPPKNMMYLAVENMNSVCSWDWQKGGESFEVCYAIPFEDAVTGWKCCDTVKGDCESEDVEERCPRGNTPHTLTEDSAGNIWVSLKFGAVARLTNPKLITNPRDPKNWFIQKAYPGDVVERTIVFYIKANVKGDTVYANGFKNNALLHIGNPTAMEPTIDYYNIDLPPELADIDRSSFGEDRTGGFPAGLRVLDNGSCLFGLYNRLGSIGKMSPSGVNTFLTLPSKDAFLHLDFDPSDDDDDSLTLWLLASSGDFTTQQQPDLMIRLDGFSPSDMTFNGGFKFRSASQGGTLHRVLAIDGGKNALYSILKDDKLAMIYDADGDSQAADLLEDIGFEFEQSCADSDQEDPKACANKNEKRCNKDPSCVWKNNQCGDGPPEDLDMASSVVHEDKPWEMKSSSSHVRMSISATLAGIFLAYLWI